MTSYIAVNSAHYSNGMSEEGKIIYLITKQTN